MKWTTFKLNGVDGRCTLIHDILRRTALTTEHRNHKRDLLDDASLTKISKQVDRITKIAPKASGLLKVVHSSNMDSMVQTGLHTLIARAYDP